MVKKLSVFQKVILCFSLVVIITTMFVIPSFASTVSIPVGDELSGYDNIAINPTFKLNNISFIRNVDCYFEGTSVREDVLFNYTSAGSFYFPRSLIFAGNLGEVGTFETTYNFWSHMSAVSRDPLYQYQVIHQIYDESSYLDVARELYPNHKFFLARSFYTVDGSMPENATISSISFSFDDFNVYEKGMPAPYVVFDRNVLDYSNTTVVVSYSYNQSTKSEVNDGALYMEPVHQTVKVTNFDSKGRVDLIPNSIRSGNKSKVILENLRVTISFVSKDDEVTPKEFGDFYVQQAYYAGLDLYDFESVVSDFGEVVKWRSISDITGWLGSTVAGFFDIEIFPNVRLSIVLGILIMTSVSIWILKLMAGG